MPLTPAERKRLQRQRDREDPDRKFRKLDTLFMFGEVDVAVIIDDNQNIWFKAVDIARALEMDEPNVGVCHAIDKKYCQTYEELNQTLCRYRNISCIHPKTTFVNETGAFKFIMRSRKPKAKSFVEWICNHVLPETRSLQQFKLAQDYEQRRKDSLKGFIYLFTSEKLKQENIYKIGYTKNIQQRLSNLNVGRPDDLLDVFLCIEVGEAFKMEKVLHCLFQDSKVRGEFYILQQNDIMKIKNLLTIE